MKDRGLLAGVGQNRQALATLSHTHLVEPGPIPERLTAAHIWHSRNLARHVSQRVPNKGEAALVVHLCVQQTLLRCVCTVDA